MKINIDAFLEHYFDKKQKLTDKWQEGIRILPFSTNASHDGVDRGAGIEGTTGLFFRIMGNEVVSPIEDSHKTERAVEFFLSSQKKMNEQQVVAFIDIMKDILFINGTLNITDTSFLKYLPIVPNDESIPAKTKEKYKSGQTKLANLLCSLYEDNIDFSDHDNKNLFTKVLKEALSSINTGFGEGPKASEAYYTLPYVKKSFNKDLKWIMSLDSSVIIRHIHLFLHFYICYELLQSIPKLTYKNRNTEKTETFYFILQSEKASASHDGVRNWKEKMPKGLLDKIFGHSQALDILNSVLGGNSVLGESVGFYKEIIDSLVQTPFEENKDACEALLNIYQKEKRNVFSNRSSESASIGEIDTSVSSYEEFVKKMEQLCVGLQSPSYISRMRKKIIDVLSIRFLQLRRGNYVLVLDNEMLLFLIAMITKSKRVKVEDMYKKFNEYGIIFNLGTKTAIESYLLKLNLLDRKSDSGEAQYVKVVL